MGKKKRSPDGVPGQRQLRAGEVVRQALSEVLQRAHFRDPDLAEANFTVTEVQASPDLRNAKVYVLPLGGENAEALVEGLNRASSYLRGEVNKRVSFKFSIALQFALDHRFDAAARIDSLLHAPGAFDDEER